MAKTMLEIHDYLIESLSGLTEDNTEWKERWYSEKEIRKVINNLFKFRGRYYNCDEFLKKMFGGKTNGKKKISSRKMASDT